jgi:DNA polymerase III epsilon subunit-like protein
VDTVDIPDFALQFLKRQKCRFCTGQFVPDDVAMQGHRRSREGRWCYCYELECSHCGKSDITVITTRPMNTKGLCRALAEIYQKPKAAVEEEAVDESEPDAEPVLDPDDTLGEIVKRNTGISDKEADAAKKIMDAAANFEEVLKKFGVTDWALEEYLRMKKAQDERDAGK